MKKGPEKARSGPGWRLKRQRHHRKSRRWKKTERGEGPLKEGPGTAKAE